MKIARFWERVDMDIPGSDGYPFPITGWGWSETSSDEAKQRAQDSAQNFATRLTAGKGFPDTYTYGTRPRREEIIEEFTNDDGELIAFNTRNHYGSLVMNTAHLMFIDIDVPIENPGSGLMRLIKEMFGKSAPPPAEATRTKIRAVAENFPNLTFRVYRTLAGFRVAVINKRISPNSMEAGELFQAFGSDPLYVKLCSNQESFRARLTPKHWRCGAEKPPMQFPYETPEARAMHENWKPNYERSCSGYAACHFIDQIGTASALHEHARLIRVHDSLTRSDTQLQLA